MSLASYLNSRKGELLLVWLSAWAVATVAMNGFFLDNLVAQHGYAFRAGIALAGTFVLSLTLFVGAHDPKRKFLAAAGYVAVCAVLVIAAVLLSSGTDVYQDAEGNYLYLALDLIIVTLAAFLLTRTLTGCMAWFVVAAFTCAAAQAFWAGGDTAVSIAAVLFALAMIIYRNFTMGIRSAQAAKKGAGAMAFASASACAVAACGIAVAIWALVIAPLGPGTLDVKLFTEYRQLPIEEYVGTAAERPQLNYDMTSKTTVDGEAYTTDDLKEDVTSDVTVDAASAMQQQALANAAGSGTGSSAGGGTKQDFSSDATNQVYSPISYDTEFPWVVVWIAVVVVLVMLFIGYFAGRRYMRRRKLRRILAKDPATQIKELYRLMLVKLERIGFTQPQGMTLTEYAASSARAMDMMTEETRVPFAAMTEVYVDCVYGDKTPTQDDAVLFSAYYLRFWKAARAQLGNLKYFFRSFRL